MSAQLGVTSGVGTAVPPTIQFQLPQQTVMPHYQYIGAIPKVKSTSEAVQFRSIPGNEDVLFDVNDPQIAYFRSTDVNGIVTVDRRRCLPEPELTPEEKADQKYLSKEEFNGFIRSFDSFREEMMQNVRAITAATTSNAATSTSKYSAIKHADGTPVAELNASNAAAGSVAG